MDKTKLLESVFNLAKEGINIPLDVLPDTISKDVVEKNLLYIELKKLIKENGDPVRISEIQCILNPNKEENNGN